MTEERAGGGFVPSHMPMHTIKSALPWSPDMPIEQATAATMKQKWGSRELFRAPVAWNVAK